ncbi:MAG: hypothetical protein ACLGGX_05030 [Bdellovibrionia bacterium]
MQFVLIGAVKNNRGGAILQGLLASVAIIVFIFSVFRYIQAQIQNANNQLYAQRLEVISSKITAAVEHNTAWKVTQEYGLNAAKFNCLRNNSCSQNWQYISLLESNGNVLLPEQGSGFTLSGKNCSDFSPDSSSMQCPFFFRVKWRPDCVGCNQSIQVATELTISKIPGLVLNTQNYVIDFIRGKIEGTLSSQCKAMGGRLNPNNLTDCILPITSSASCLPGTYLNGTDTNGNRVCRPIQGVFQRCSRGVATIRANGSLACN